MSLLLEPKLAFTKYISLNSEDITGRRIKPIYVLFPQNENERITHLFPSTTVSYAALFSQKGNYFIFPFLLEVWQKKV